STSSPTSFASSSATRWTDRPLRIQSTLRAMCRCRRVARPDGHASASMRPSTREDHPTMKHALLSLLAVSMLAAPLASGAADAYVVLNGHRYTIEIAAD